MLVMKDLEKFYTILVLLQACCSAYQMATPEQAQVLNNAIAHSVVEMPAERLPELVIPLKKGMSINQ